MRKQIFFIALLGLQLLCSSMAASAQESYKVGDFYSDDDKMGVVFWVDESGQHGKIISLDESPKLAWTKYEGSIRKFVETFDKNDGGSNFSRICVRGGWQRDYPAFAWCAELGEGWYIPAVEEMKMIMSKEVYPIINEALQGLFQLGAVEFGLGEDYPLYWTSTEEYTEQPFWVYVLPAGSTSTDHIGEKWREYRVRAVARF